MQIEAKSNDDDSARRGRKSSAPIFLSARYVPLRSSFFGSLFVLFFPLVAVMAHAQMDEHSNAKLCKMARIGFPTIHSITRMWLLTLVVSSTRDDYRNWTLVGNSWQCSWWKFIFINEEIHSPLKSVVLSDMVISSSEALFFRCRFISIEDKFRSPPNRYRFVLSR